MNSLKFSRSSVVCFVLCSLATSTLTFVCADFVAAQEASVAVKSMTRLGVSTEQPAAGPFVKIEGGFMVPYTASIPGTKVKFEMLPVPGGTFTMGSPADEKGRLIDEGPQFNVVVEPFWMGKYEVTWEEYESYMAMDDVFRELRRREIRMTLKKFSLDAVTAPSELYDRRIHYGAGDGANQPAATMTQFAAKQYTKWLSLTSQEFYRLPYEAEWEYACRANTKTSYSFGNNVKDLGDHGWFVENSDELRHIVGKKKPNGFGLFDMHGNVAEWVLDGYNKKGYTHLKAGKTYSVEQTFNKPKTVFSRVARGGSWELDGADCRSAARLASHEDWQSSEATIPGGPCWLTDSPGLGVGFRLIRPLKAPVTLVAKNEFWKPDLAVIEERAIHRAESQGRGVLGKADEKLPAEMAEVLEED